MVVGKSVTYFIVRLKSKSKEGRRDRLQQSGRCVDDRDVDGMLGGKDWVIYPIRDAAGILIIVLKQYGQGCFGEIAIQGTSLVRDTDLQVGHISRVCATSSIGYIAWCTTYEGVSTLP